MTQCPKCNRTYSEDFAFCLDDGTPLKPSASQQATLVTPSPQNPPPTLVMPSSESQPPTLVMPPAAETQQPSPSPLTAPRKDVVTRPPSISPTSRPRAAATAPPVAPATATPNMFGSAQVPASTASRRPIVAVVVGVLGVLLIVVVLGAVGLLLLSQNQGQNQNQTPTNNQNSSSAPSSAAANPNPGATIIPLDELKPNSSASSSTTGETSSSEGVIAPGSYQCELTRKMGEGTKVTVALRIQIAVNMDGSYVSRGYMTIAEANIHDQLGIEERGNYSQSGDTLILTNRKEREFNFDTGRWKGWTTPDDGAESREKVRNVTPQTFQLFDDEEKQWFTFTKT